MWSLESQPQSQSQAPVSVKGKQNKTIECKKFTRVRQYNCKNIGVIKIPNFIIKMKACINLNVLTFD